MKAHITEDQWLEELSKLTTKRNDPGLTAKEMSKASGLSVLRIRDMLRLARDAGRLKLGVRDEMRIDGRSYQTHVYRIASAKVRVAAKKRRR